MWNFLKCCTKIVLQKQTVDPHFELILPYISSMTILDWNKVFSPLVLLIVVKYEIGLGSLFFQYVGLQFLATFFKFYNFNSFA